MLGKKLLSVAAAVVLALSTTGDAQPHRIGHKHALRNAELVERAVVTITRTITHYAAPTTTLVTATRKVTTTAVKPAPSPKVNDVKDEEPVEVKSNNENNPPAEQQASAETGDNSNATAEPVGEGKYRDIPGKAGIVYSPYKPGGCKTAEEIKSEMSKLGSYGLFRLYGVDCNQIANVLSIVKGMGPDKKMFIGVYNLKNWQAELDTLVSEVGDDWSYIHTVSIGNEAVHNGMDAGEVVSIVKQAKEKLRASGYNGPVVTTEALYKVLADPRLCEAMDYIGVNCHPFYDPNTSADKAGDFLQNQIETVKKTCGGNKEVLITETGWPHRGQANGGAVPTKPNQVTAVNSILDKVGHNVILLTAFDEMWKTNNADQFGAEQFWGIEN